jgi:SSS family solute:Na+ symporter
VPGVVVKSQFTYMMVVFGYLLGYLVIAKILLPIYYKMNLTTIYTYLEHRLGRVSYRMGSFYFIISRTIGASFRLFIVVNVLQKFVFDEWGVPFIVTVASFIILILLYTYKGGVKTIVWTDTLQTTFMLLAVILSVILILSRTGLTLGDAISKVNDHYANFINRDWQSKSFFLKQFFGGMFIAIAMTGLDQEMMQKNISVRTLKDSQKNMYVFSLTLVFINLMFLFLGALLYIYADAQNITISGRLDDTFPIIALNHLGIVAAVFFIIGLISAAYPSADGALTALTSTFCIDFLDFKKRKWTDEKQKHVRYAVHICFAAILLALIVIFRMINDDSVINELFTVAGYTYGPLLGLFAFGLLTKRKVEDRLVPIVCLLSPAICYYLNTKSVEWFSGYQFGFELLIVNGLITFLGLLAISSQNPENSSNTQYVSSKAD